jgi:hypothetical protein
MELDRERVISFVLSRETAEGGFSFAQTTPRTLEDTYYALRTLDALGYDYRCHKTLEYMRHIPLDRYTPPKTVWQVVYLSQLVRVDAHDGVGTLVALKLSTMNSHQSFQDLFFLLRSLSHVRPECHITHRLRSRVFHLSIADLRTMDNVFRQLLLMRQMGIPFSSSTYGAWIRSAQNGDGGFGFYPGTTSFLENTYYALRALELLGSAPVDIEGCKRFVQGCRASNGGFGRQSITVPRLDSTYHAVSSLARLYGMPCRDPRDTGSG